MCTPVRYLGALRYGDFQPLPARPGGEVELGLGTPWNSTLHILMSKIIQKTNTKFLKLFMNESEICLIQQALGQIFCVGIDTVPKNIENILIGMITQ